MVGKNGCRSAFSADLAPHGQVKQTILFRHVPPQDGGQLMNAQNEYVLVFNLTIGNGVAGANDHIQQAENRCVP